MFWVLPLPRYGGWSCRHRLGIHYKHTISNIITQRTAGSCWPGGATQIYYRAIGRPWGPANYSLLTGGPARAALTGTAFRVVWARGQVGATQALRFESGRRPTVVLPSHCQRHRQVPLSRVRRPRRGEVGVTRAFKFQSLRPAESATQ